jgi:hypothetical protein
MTRQGSRAKELVGFLSEELNMRVRRDEEETSGMRVYWVDASEWRIRLSSETPLIDTCPTGCEEVSDQQLLDSIVDVAIQKNLQNTVLLAVIPGRNRESIRQGHWWQYQSVLLDDQDVQDIIASQKSFQVIIDKILEQLPLGILSPYQFGAPVTGSSFFGRRYELTDPSTTY